MVWRIVLKGGAMGGFDFNALFWNVVAGVLTTAVSQAFVAAWRSRAALGGGVLKFTKEFLPSLILAVALIPFAIIAALAFLFSNVIALLPSFNFGYINANYNPQIDFVIFPIFFYIPLIIIAIKLLLIKSRFIFCLKTVGTFWSIIAFELVVALILRETHAFYIFNLISSVLFIIINLFTFFSVVIVWKEDQKAAS